MNYYVYYDNGTKKTIRSFDGNKEQATSFFRSILDVNPYDRYINCCEFISLMWDYPDSYTDPVLIICNLGYQEYDYYNDEIQEFLALVKREEDFAEAL